MGLSPDRWNAVERLYHAALARPVEGRAAYLAEACADDEELRCEVESLLAQEQLPAGVLTSGAVVAAAALVTDAGHSVISGRRIGPYQILGPLGAGGMGEVYRARDTRLGRDVAIKVLPRAFTADADRLARFEREARVLASLNHPHIAAIYGVEEAAVDDGVHLRALVLELVPGETLAERITRAGRKGLPVTEALAIARQIADALDAAHETGIIHRDLKPANIKITPQGIVKVLDFGLAKLDVASEPDGVTAAPTITVGNTREGFIVGTAAYMSPEQARGQTVDKRTDIWALGCLLYEMLTGRAVFARATVTDTLAAVVDVQPDWSALPHDLSDTARRLIRRCLAKDIRKRLQHVGDARFDLDEAETPVIADTSPPSHRARLPHLIPWASLSGILVLGALVYVLRPSPSAPADLEGTIERVTSDPGYTTRPALSQDGKLLAYASDRSGRGDMDIWVQQTSGGIPLRVTDDVADDDQPAFSADGSQITFRSERNGGGIYIAPALGGAARLIAKDGRNPRFSPNGTRIAYWTGQFRGNPSQLTSAAFVISLTGGAPTRILSDFAMARQPIWSPDGQSLMVLARRNLTASLTDTFDYWWVPLDGRAPVRSGLLDLRSLRSSTDAELVDTGEWTNEGVFVTEGATLWSIPVSPSTGRVTGSARQLSFGTGRFASPTTNGDGAVAFSVPAIQRVIKRAPLGRDVDAPAVPLYTDVRSTTARASTSRDGLTIVFERVSGSRVEIWRKDLLTGDQVPLFSQEIPGRSEAQRLLNATISQDARLIGYTVPVEGQTGQGAAYVIDAAGGVPKHVCDDCLLHEFLSDGRHAVVSNRDRSLGIVDVENGTSALLVDAQQDALVDRPSVSPDDRWVAFRRVVDTKAKVLIAPVAPGRPVRSDRAAQVDEPTITGRPTGWSPDSHLLYLLLDTDGFRCLWAQPVDPSSGRPVGRPYLVRHFHRENLGTSLGNAVTDQGFLYESSTVTGNIWRLIRPPSTR